jgi:hypothetical protein
VSKSILHEFVGFTDHSLLLRSQILLPRSRGSILTTVKDGTQSAQVGGRREDISRHVLQLYVHVGFSRLLFGTMFVWFLNFQIFLRYDVVPNVGTEFGRTESWFDPVSYKY